jgi:parallel beta-helix repeat protein
VKKNKPSMHCSHSASGTKPGPSLHRRPLVAAIALSLSLSTASVQAANIWVDSSSDTDTGVCRLRDAIIAANTDAVVEGCTAGSGADFIRLLNIAEATIALSGSRLPTVTSNITIQGESVTIDAQGNSGLLDVGGGSLTISRLSLVNGYADEVDDHSGGGIRVRNGASLSLHESTISNSTATSNGGGISLESGGENVVIMGSTLSNNAALGTVYGTFGSGGGLWLAQPVAGDITLSLKNSTLSGNTASVTTGFGGALYSFDSTSNTAHINISSSTLFGNTAGQRGGAIYTYGAQVFFVNSIIANSTSIYSPTHAACSGVLIGPDGISLVEDKAGCGTVPEEFFFDEDPNLGPLADNGGPTFTHAPIGTTNADSPVIDALDRQCFYAEITQTGVVVLQLDLSSDQRGYERTDQKCDLGAFEVGGAGLQPGPDFVINSNIDEYMDPDAQNIEPYNDPDFRRLTGDGHCNIAPGDCTMRDAVNAANVSADESTITIAESVPAEFYMRGVEPLLITSNLTIQGDGRRLYQDHEGEFTFHTRNITLDSARLSIHDLAIDEGRALSSSGGGILARNEATLQLFNSSMRYNRAWGDSGGAIEAGPGVTVTIAGSEINNNIAGLQGGGINLGVGAVLTMTDSTLSGNSVNSGCLLNISSPPRCGGGGLFVQSGTASLLNSFVSQNQLDVQSAAYGGGIYAVDSVIRLGNSTLAGNTVTGSGGGLFIRDTDVTLTNSTLSSNQQAVLGGALYSEGNSIVRVFNSTFFANGRFDRDEGSLFFVGTNTLEISNSIIANSLGRDCEGSPSIIASGVNLVGDGGGFCGFTPGPELLTGDAMLGPLGDNGGPTLTHRPLTGSPVIEAGSNAAIPTGLDYDQRGSGYPRIYGTNVDLGAVELGSLGLDLIFGDGFEEPPP